MNCITCGIFDGFDSLALTYSKEAFESLAPTVKTIFTSLTSLWFLFVCGRALMGKTDWSGFVIGILVFAVVGVALEGYDFYWTWVYEPARAIMSGVTQAVVGKAGVSDPSFSGMLAVVENQVAKVLKVSFGILEDASFFEVINLIGGVVLLLPYVLVWGIFLAFVVEGIFRMTAVAAIGPMVLLWTAFRPTRGWAMGAFRILLGGILLVIFAGVAMGFTIQVVDVYTATLPVTISPDGQFSFTIEADKFVLSGDYLAILLVGFVSVLFHLKAGEFAASISGAPVGVAAASAVVTGAMASIGAVKAAALVNSNRVGQTVRGVAKSYAAAEGAELMSDPRSVRGQMLKRLTR